MKFHKDKQPEMYCKQGRIHSCRGPRGNQNVEAPISTNKCFDVRISYKNNEENEASREHGIEASGSMKSLGNSWVAEQLTVSRGLRSIELISSYFL
jgi:hypothetical protein